MKPGSVIVDLAVEQGGNVEGAVAGEIVERHGVKIVGHRNVPSRLAADTSALYARNLYNFLSARSEEHTSDLQSLMRLSYAVFCLKKQKNNSTNKQHKYDNITSHTSQCHEPPSTYFK